MTLIHSLKKKRLTKNDIGCIFRDTNWRVALMWLLYDNS